MVPATPATWPIASLALPAIFIIAHYAQLILNYQMELASSIMHARLTVLHALLNHVFNVSLAMCPVLQMIPLALLARLAIA